MAAATHAPMTAESDDRRSSTAQRPGPSQGPRRGAAHWRPRRVVSSPQTIESYLRGNSPPRYMLRLRQIETVFQAEHRRLDAAYRELLETHGDDAERFSRRWRRLAREWRFEHLNHLIREHNDWYPVEASLPMDPRTRDFRPVRGASYRRLELDERWVLEHFPPDPGGAERRGQPPSRAPREPLRQAPRAEGRGRGHRR